MLCAASIVNDANGSRLVMNSSATGAANGFRVQATDDDGNNVDNAGLSALAYDPANLDMVYLLDSSAPLQFHACHLTDASAAHQNLSAAEIARLPRLHAPLPGATMRTTSQGMRSFVG